MTHIKTVEIIIEDVSELQHLMYLYLIEKGVINLNTLTDNEKTKLLNPAVRLKFIKEFIAAYLHANARFSFETATTYHDYLDPIFKEYVENEFSILDRVEQNGEEVFRDIQHNSSSLQELFSNMETDIVNSLPEKLTKKTWHFWTVSLTAESIIYRNEGDYRILTFAKDFLADKNNPNRNRVSKEALYEHYRS